MLGAVNFVAYDPAKRTCNPADRSLIKRHAGRLGSETKKRRLHRERGGKNTSSSAKERAESAASNTTDRECKRLPQPMAAQPWQSVLATTSRTATPSSVIPDPYDSTIWTHAESSTRQHALVRDSTPKSWNDSTTSASDTHPNRWTHARSASFNEDTIDPLSLRSEFTEPNFGGYRPQDTYQPQQDLLARTFGSFDSGFCDNESSDFSLVDIDADTGSAPDAPACQQQTENVTNEPSESLSWLGWPSTDTLAHHTTQHDSITHGFTCVDTFCEKTKSRPPNQSNCTTRHTPANVDTPLMNPPTRLSFRNMSATPEQVSPRTSDRRVCPDVDDMLVQLISYREEHGQLPTGSSAECLRALSENEEARSLWILNLSRVKPELASCLEQPTDVHAKATTKLRSMTHRQQMGVQGILIKLGLAEYHAISFALEVTSLQQDVSNRKCLGILSKAEALMDHSLVGLESGAQSVLDHLWPYYGPSG